MSYSRDLEEVEILQNLTILFFINNQKGLLKIIIIIIIQVDA